MVRVAVLGITFILAATGRIAPAAAQSDEGAEPGDEMGEQAPPAAAPQAGQAVKQKAKGGKRRGRKSLKHGRFSGRVVAESALRKDPLDPPSGDLEILSLGLHNESVK